MAFECRRAPLDFDVQIERIAGRSSPFGSLLAGET